MAFPEFPDQDEDVHDGDWDVDEDEEGGGDGHDQHHLEHAEQTDDQEAEGARQAQVNGVELLIQGKVWKGLTGSKSNQLGPKLTYSGS